MAALFESGARIAHGLRRGRQGVTGWIAWTSDGPLQIEMVGADETPSFSVDPDPDHPLATAEVLAAEVAIEAPGAGRLALDAEGRRGRRRARRARLGGPPWPARAPAALDARIG